MRLLDPEIPNFSIQSQEFAALKKRFPFRIARCRPVRIGFIGLGWIAEIAHFPAIEFLQEEGWPIQVTALCDTREERGEAALGRFPGARLFRDAAAMLASGSCDAVFILTFPPATGELIRRAIEAGVAVFAEKPVTENLAEFTALIELVRRNQRMVQIGYNRRFQLLDDLFGQELARTENIISVKFRLWRVRRGEAIFYKDTMVHILNFAQYHFGTLRFLAADCGSVFDSSSKLPSAIFAKFTDDRGATYEFDVRPRVGRDLESCEVIALDRSFSLCYAAAHNGSSPASFEVHENGSSHLEELFLSGQDAEAMAYARGFMHQAGSFLRAASGQEESNRCDLEDALQTQAAFERTWDSLESPS